MATAKEIAKGFRAAARAVKANAMRAEEQNARDLHETILGYFSGPFDAAQQRRMYNPRGPYSVVDPHPPAPPEFVNVQTGTVREEWEQEGPAQAAGGRIVTAFVNEDPISDYLLDGTEKMIERPYREAILQDIAPRVAKRRAEAWQKAMKKMPVTNIGALPEWAQREAITLAGQVKAP